MTDCETEPKERPERGRPWNWGDSLGGIHPNDGRSYHIRRIVFDLVKDRCAELGLKEGETVRCRKRDHRNVVVELSDGAMRSLELTYARFVQVEPTSGGPDLGLRA